MTNTNNNLNSSSIKIPSELSNLLADICSKDKPAHIKQKLGQFFTPDYTAKFMVEFSEYIPTKKKITILEPGVGLAILSATLVEYLITFEIVEEIELTCYEIDEDLFNYTESVLSSIFFFCLKKNKRFTYNLIQKDFILSNRDVFSNRSHNLQKFDFIISNPPFFKLPNNDERVKLAANVIYGLPNIYNIFFYISTKLLEDNGKLLFLIPRSFCSGSHYKQIREHFIENIKLLKIHLFSSEEKIFHTHSVLYESVIVYAEKSTPSNSYSINITHSNNIKEEVNINYNCNFTLNENIIELPTSNTDLAILVKMHSWNNSLFKSGFSITHGKLIITKAENLLFNNNDLENLVPMIWIYNIETGIFDFNAEDKYGKYLINEPNTKKYIINNNNYIFLRRYNNNDYIKRIVATPYLKEYLDGNYLGIERLISFIEKSNYLISKEEVFGVSAILNSQFVNSYLGMINGIINVTSDIILNIPLPEESKIKEIGEAIINKTLNEKDLFNYLLKI